MPRSVPVRCCCCFLVGAAALLAAGDAARAQPPAIQSASPQAVRPGETIDVTLRGANLAAPGGLWTSFPAEGVLSPDVANNGQNAAEVTYRITVPAEAAVGVHGLRVVTQAGVSALRLFVVDDLPSVAAKTDNKLRDAAQELALPVAVDGYVDGLSYHYFKFRAEAGQRIAFDVLARRIGS
ncbi:MAG TPA: hypothetical protein VML55_25645, partial [Planctomycetaceae bacterium]|nr:hypothetical protein [Planctomycetaceae bacterium]